jgi:hypothetical protein
MDFGIADDGERTGHEQAAQIAATLLADMAKPDIGLNVGWWHQAHGMAKRLELARPMVR